MNSCNEPQNPIRSLISRWGEKPVATFARDIGVTVEHASAFNRRRSIPVRYWPRVVAAAVERGIDGVTYDYLVSIHSKDAAA